MSAVIILVCAVCILSIFRYPEFGFTLILMISVLKPLLEEYFPIFLSVDLSLVLFLSVVIGFFLNYFLVIKRFHIPLNTSVLYLIFLLMLCISVIHTPTMMYGLSKLFRFMMFGSILFFTSMMIFQNSEALNRFLKLGAISILILAIAHLIFFFIALASMDLDLLYTLRFSIAGNVIGSARLFGMGILLLFTFLFQSKKTKMIVLYLIVLLILLLALISTNTRGPMLAIILSIPLVFVVVTKRSFVVIVLTLIIFFTVGISVFVFLPEQVTNRFVALVSKPEIGGIRILYLWMSNSQRLFFWESTITKYFDSNIVEGIMGHGLGSFSLIWPGFDTRYYPHNMILELLYEGGIATLAVFLFLLFLTIRLVFHYLSTESKSDFRMLSMFIIFIYFLLNSMVSGDINDNRLILIFWGGMLGIITSCSVNPKPESPVVY